jgi:hypothetical protein
MKDWSAARMFLSAFNRDSIQIWIAATKEWGERPYVGPIGEAVKELREAWYHDGTDAARGRCVDAANALRNVLGNAATPDSAASPTGGEG